MKRVRHSQGNVASVEVEQFIIGSVYMSKVQEKVDTDAQKDSALIWEEFELKYNAPLKGV